MKRFSESVPKVNDRQTCFESVVLLVKGWYVRGSLSPGFMQ